MRYLYYQIVNAPIGQQNIYWTNLEEAEKHAKDLRKWGYKAEVKSVWFNSFNRPF